LLLGAILLVEVAFLWFAVIGRGTVIEGRQGELDRIKTFLTVETRKDEVPSPELRKQYEKIKESYGDHEKTLRDYYISRDQAFEPQNLGPLAEYRVAYVDHMDQLEAEFREKTGAPELEGNKRRFRLEQGFDEPDMVLVEKRFRIQKELADILIQCGVKDLVQVRFVTEKKEKKRSSKKKKGKDEGPLIEYDTHDLTADIVCDFETIPVLLATIHQSQNIPFRLRRMLMRKATVMGEQELDDNESMEIEDGNTIVREFLHTEEQAYQNLTDDEIFPEPPVELVLSLEVVDIREMAETPED
jgi:hypothetical protein